MIDENIHIKIKTITINIFILSFCFNNKYNKS